MRYKIRHITSYHYKTQVDLCYNLALLSPASTERQTVVFNDIYLNPYPSSTRELTDFYGNSVLQFDIQKPHEKLIITAESEVDVHEVANQPSLNLTIKDVGELMTWQTDANYQLAKEFLLNSPMIKQVHTAYYDYAKDALSPSNNLHLSVLALTEKIFTEFTYDPEFTQIATPLIDVLEHKRGVCQDFAHLQIACLRAHGIPAKYVSGYIETLPPPGQKKLRGVDATHAWVSYFCPESGWIDIDPTNNALTNHQYIVTATGRDFQDVSPVKGVIFGGGAPALNVSVDVARISS